MLVIITWRLYRGHGSHPSLTFVLIKLLRFGIALNYRHTILIGNSAVISVSGHWKDWSQGIGSVSTADGTFQLEVRW